MESLALGALLLVLACMDVPYATGQSQVFRCTMDGVTTFSDRPCGTDAEAYEPDDALMSTFEAPPAPVAPKSPPKRPAREPRRNDASIAIAQAKHAETCARIERSLRDIRSKMRAGYDAKQGERLNERHRKLSAQKREQRC
jgi:hypothetical protein